MIYRLSMIALCIFAMGCSAGEGGNVANPFVYVAGYHNTITCFVLDMATGELKPSSTSDGGKNPTYIAWSPNHKFMYACNETGPGKIAAFSINPKDGALTRLNDAGLPQDGAIFLIVRQRRNGLFCGICG